MENNRIKITFPKTLGKPLLYSLFLHIFQDVASSYVSEKQCFHVLFIFKEFAESLSLFFSPWLGIYSLLKKTHLLSLI